MNRVIMSEEAYEEFKAFLNENNIYKYLLRINHVGNSCSGPVFNISVEDSLEDKKENDVIEENRDISFFIDKALIAEFDGFIISSTEENGGTGLSLRAINAPIGGCSTCGGGCH